MKSRLEIRPVDKHLCDFTTPQKLLIKSRLYLYRCLLGTGGAKPVAWAKLADTVNELLDPVEQDAELHAHLKERYRYYLLSRPKQNQQPPTQADIDAAALNISDDMLHRWFKGKDDRRALDGKRRYMPPDEVIAAVRDMLVLKGLLHEKELETDAPYLAASFAINRLFETDADEEREAPELASAYVSISHDGSGLRYDLLNLQPSGDAGVMALWADSLIDRSVEKHGVERMLARVRMSRKTELRGQSGHVPLGAAPTWIALLDGKAGRAAAMILVEPTSFQGRKVVSLRFRPLRSYEWLDGKPALAARFRQSREFVDIDSENMFEYFDEIMDNIEGYDPFSFQKTKIYEGDVEEGNTSKSELLFKILEERADWDNPRDDKGVAAQMIRDGVDVNAYRSPRGVTVAHLAASCRMQDVLEALMEVENLDLLARDRSGHTAADYAFTVDAEWGERLTQRMVEQAQRQGIDLGDWGRSAAENAGQAYDDVHDDEEAVLPDEHWTKADFEDGKALHQAIERLITDPTEDLIQYDYDLPARIIANGGAVNHIDRWNGTTPLHNAAFLAHKQTLDAILAHPDTNYLVKDCYGETPADFARRATAEINESIAKAQGIDPGAYAARMSSEYAEILTQKMAEQAQRQGIDLDAWLAEPPPVRPTREQLREESFPANNFEM